jgi:hypothetical protein
VTEPSAAFSVSAARNPSRSRVAVDTTPTDTAQHVGGTHDTRRRIAGFVFTRIPSAGMRAAMLAAKGKGPTSVRRCAGTIGIGREPRFAMLIATSLAGAFRVPPGRTVRVGRDLGSAESAIAEAADACVVSPFIALVDGRLTIPPMFTCLRPPRQARRWHRALGLEQRLGLVRPQRRALASECHRHRS